jgi:fatty acid-binding protein DegV
VVTDSTATLPPALARAAGVRVVSLDVVVGGRRTLDGDLDGADLLAALERGERPVTSQPPPAAFAAAYERAAAEGASAVVSVHLSGALSGTVAAARTAAVGAAVPVVVVDSGTVAMGLGFAALAAARAGADVVQPAPWWRRWREAVPGRAVGETPGGVPDVAEVAATAQAVAASSSVWFLVDSLDYLRRGGRLSGTAALLGTILQLRPLLTVADGRLAVAEKVRTRRTARARLVQLAVESVLARPQARLAVQHLDNLEAADEMVGQIVAATGDRVVETVVTEAGAVLAAHVGPGALAVTVADAETPAGLDRDALGVDRSALGVDRSALGTDRSALGMDRSALAPRPSRRDPSPAPRSAVPRHAIRTTAPTQWRWFSGVSDARADEPSPAPHDDGPAPGPAG